MTSNDIFLYVSFTHQIRQIDGQDGKKSKQSFSVQENGRNKICSREKAAKNDKQNRPIERTKRGWPI